MVRFPISSSCARRSHRSVPPVQVGLGVEGEIVLVLLARQKQVAPVFDVLAVRAVGPDPDFILGTMVPSGLMMQVTGTWVRVRIWPLAMKVWKDRRETEVSGYMGMAQGDFHQVHLPDNAGRLCLVMSSERIWSVPLRREPRTWPMSWDARAIWSCTFSWSPMSMAPRHHFTSSVERQVQSVVNAAVSGRAWHAVLAMIPHGLLALVPGGGDDL